MAEAQAVPASVQTEITVLGAALLDATAINDALEHLTAADFALDSHSRIFTVISELAETGNPVDLITVMEDLTRRRWLDAVGGTSYLAFLTEGIPRNPNIESYCRIVKDKSLLRQMVSIFSEGMALASDQSELASDVLGSVEERLLQLADQAQSRGFTNLMDAIGETGGIDDYLEKVCDPRELTGLSTGFEEIDKATGGLQNGDLIVIAGRSGMGKSAWGLNLSENVVTEDGKAVVAFFSVEMSRDSLHKRLLASVAGVESRKAQSGFLTGDDRKRLSSALFRIADKHLMIDDTATITTLQMRAKCRRLKQKMGRLDLVVVDYLQIVRGVGKFGSRQEEVGAISRGLKALAKEIDVPVVALAQVNRQPEQRSDKRPMMSDLRESGAIEMDADIIAFLYRDEYYHSADDPNCERGIAEFIIAKARNGPTGTHKLAYSASITRFNNLVVNRSENTY